MRKFLTIIISIIMILGSFTTVLAEDEILITSIQEPTTMVTIPVSSNVDTAKIILDGAKHLPEITEITKEGIFEIDFSDAEPGDVYRYTVSQIIDDENYAVDNTVYNVIVYILFENDVKYATAIIDGGNTEKPVECSFENEKIEKPVEPVKPEEPTPEPPKPVDDTKEIVKTGDTNKPWLWVGVGGGALVLAGILIFILKKKDKEN